MSVMPMKRAVGLLAGALFLLAAGCSDKYSQRRIEMRNENLDDQARSIRLLDEHRIQRLHEMQPCIDKWYQEEVDLFRERTTAAGDYVW